MIRIGANPICWSNDDMIEIAGIFGWNSA